MRTSHLTIGSHHSKCWYVICCRPVRMPICYKAAAIGQSLIDDQEVHKGKTPKSGKHDLKQNRNFRSKGEGRSGRRPLLPKRKLNILVDLTLVKSYHSVVTFLHAQKIKCFTFSIQTTSKLISYYVCPWKVGP